jgi:hypothetical protein
MSIPRIQATPQSSLPFGEEAKPSFRTKTAATRLTPEELVEIESAAEDAGKALSEWLRETALRAALQRLPDPAELVLAELWAVRYALLNLFHAAARRFPALSLPVPSQESVRGVPRLQSVESLGPDGNPYRVTVSSWSRLLSSTSCRATTISNRAPRGMLISVATRPSPN